VSHDSSNWTATSLVIIDQVAVNGYKGGSIELIYIVKASLDA
jgi:hypothetical protein